MCKAETTRWRDDVARLSAARERVNTLRKDLLGSSLTISQIAKLRGNSVLSPSIWLNISFCLDPAQFP